MVPRDYDVETKAEWFPETGVETTAERFPETMM